MSKTFNNLFLSVGAMKAGTTWLYAVLGRHPAMSCAIEKEIHYFHHKYVDRNQLSEKHRLTEAKNRFLTRYDPDKANIDVIRRNLHWVSAYLDRPVDDFWYRNLFQLRDKEIYACDFSNLNAHLPIEAWPQIADKCDRLRVLYTMRDPIKRLWSHTRFQLQISGDTDKLSSWGPDDFEEFVRAPHIWKNAEYGQVLRDLRAGLEPEQRKIIFYEDLHANQRGVLREIEKFLDLPAFNYPQSILDLRLAATVKHEMPAFFSELFAKDVARIRLEVEAEGFKLPAKWG